MSKLAFPKPSLPKAKLRRLTFSKLPRIQPGRRLGLILVGLLLVLSAGACLWNSSYNQDPTELFWESIDAGMTTEGVTCTIDKTTKGRHSVQAIALDLASKANARTLTTLTEDGTKVVTDALTTKTDNYIRYTEIILPNNAAKQPDFSKVLNVWSKESLKDTGNPSFFDQTAYGGCIVPLGNITAAESTKYRAEMMSDKVLIFDKTKTKWIWKFDEPVREYVVEVPPMYYVPFMQQFARTAGSTTLSRLNVTEYSRQKSEDVVIRVGIQSHRIQQIKYVGKDVTISFSKYDEKPDTTVPKNTVSAEELQKRLQAVK